MSTKRTSSLRDADDLRSEYALDYGKSTPNWFAKRLEATTLVALQPDVAEVFHSAQAVNDLLRSAIAATGVRAKAPRTRTARKRGQRRSG